MTTPEAIHLMTVEGPKVCPGWIIDEANTEVVTSAAAWLAREPQDGIDLNKGLLIIGNVGSGKSWMFRVIRAAMRAAYGSQFGIRSAQDLCRDFSEYGYQGIDDWMKGPHVCFDDLGAEQQGAHYSNKTNLMAEIIEARYDRLSRGERCWTHLSTNLGTDAIAERYGARSASRIRQMCNVLTLGARSEDMDRRAMAPGILQPLEAQSADNIYSVIHPTIAAKLNEAIAPKVKQMREAVQCATSSDVDAAYRDKCAKASDPELRHARLALKKKMGDQALAYIEIIEAEMQRRTQTA